MDNAIYLPDTTAYILREEGKKYFGGSQDWYKEEWQRQAGCGPTNCASLLWYLAQSDESCRALCPYATGQKEDFLQLMEAVWPYVTPGRMGVNTTAILTKGAKRYGEAMGVPLLTQALNIAPRGGWRKYEEVSAFITKALQRRLPVAFLNLSCGKLKNLHSWHWVTIVALRGDTALIYDYGTARWIDLREWLETTALGGGFVTLEPAGRANEEA